MTDFFFARSQMAVSLAFHIVFAAIGIGMPPLMAISEGLYLRRREAIYLDLARRWANGTAILFAVGAVSGTVLSFGLDLLWPRFMAYADGIIGMPFSLEGFAFFTEAIFLAIYLYGWNRIPAVLHWLAGILVAVSGMASGVFVVTVNAWMNAPTGFDVVGGRVTNIDPIAAMLADRQRSEGRAHLDGSAGSARAAVRPPCRRLGAGRSPAGSARRFCP